MFQQLTSEKQKTLNIKRTLNLSIGTVWEALSMPETFKKWWGPQGYTCPECIIDFKISGKYLACMRAPNNKDYWSTGRFEEIVPMKRIVYSDSFADSTGKVIPASDVGMPGEWPMELKVTIELDGNDSKTILMLKHEGLPSEMLDDCMKSWNESFDKMEKNLKLEF